MAAAMEEEREANEAARQGQQVSAQSIWDLHATKQCHQQLIAFMLLTDLA